MTWPIALALLAVALCAIAVLGVCLWVRSDEVRIARELGRTDARLEQAEGVRSVLNFYELPAGAAIELRQLFGLVEDPGPVPPAGWLSS
jgi:hypothetical protein